jgi:hypothetical protein
MSRAEREKAIFSEWTAITEPHRERIRELRRMIAIEEEHINRKGGVVRTKSETLRFPAEGVVTSNMALVRPADTGRTQ